MVIEDLTLDLSQAIEIAAPIGDAYDALIRRITVHSTRGGDDTPMPMKLEQWPGGRWYRDLGDQQGHLWGFVQVIKPPTLIELHGPMFMSYPAINHIQFRLTETDTGCQLALHHRVIGIVPQEHREGIGHGWTKMLEDVQRMSA